MLWAPARENATCAECVEIARELNEAHAGGPLEMGHGAHQRPIDAKNAEAAREALLRLMGGTEEDAECADEILHKYRFQPQYHAPKFSPAAMPALRRCMRHAARTGHIG